MNRDFPRVITFLRKERKLSQKQAAQELGVSQALLSHYEKGVRQCGLDFLVKAANYYHVSCDYLLGRTVDRDYDLSELGQESESKKQTAAQLVNRRLLGSMLRLIYDLSAAAKNRRLDRTITNCFMLGVYRVFRCLYEANPDHSDELFTIPQSAYGGYTEAALIKGYTDIEALTRGDSESYLGALGQIDLSPEKLAEEYPESAGEIFNVIQQAENVLAKMK